MSQGYDGLQSLVTAAANALLLQRVAIGEGQPIWTRLKREGLPEGQAAVERIGFEMFLEFVGRVRPQITPFSLGPIFRFWVKGELQPSLARLGVVGLTRGLDSD
jgi:hypothetical protein